MRLRVVCLPHCVFGVSCSVFRRRSSVLGVSCYVVGVLCCVFGVHSLGRRCLVVGVRVSGLWCRCCVCSVCCSWYWVLRLRCFAFGVPWSVLGGRCSCLRSSVWCLPCSGSALRLRCSFVGVRSSVFDNRSSVVGFVSLVLGHRVVFVFAVLVSWLLVFAFVRGTTQTSYHE